MRVPRRFFVSTELLQQDEIRLPAEEARHARVLRLEVGEDVEVLDGEGGVRSARVEAVAADGPLLLLGNPAPARSPAVQIELLVALLDSDRFDQLVRGATELGVGSIRPVVSRRVRGGLVAGAGRRRERWERIAREAIKQCGGSHVPEIGDAVPLDAVLEPAPVLLDSSGSTEIPDLEVPVRLLLGPEGGWEPDELVLIEKSGALTWSLGERVLRAETAAVVAAGRVLGAATPPRPAPSAR